MEPPFIIKYRHVSLSQGQKLLLNFLMTGGVKLMFKLRFKLNPSPGDYGSPQPHCIPPRSCPIKKQMSGTIHSQVLYYMHLIQGILNCVKPLTCYLGL